MTISDLAAAEGLDYLEHLMPSPVVVEVFDGPAPLAKPNGSRLLARVVAIVDEHPTDTLLRALAQARHVRATSAGAA